MKKIVVSGSTAYDNIMYSNTNLKDHIVWKKMSNINVSYLVSNLSKEIWWTWLNISYNLALLWTKSFLFSSVWNDFIFSSFIKKNVNLDYVNISKNKLSSRSYITTDNKTNQITAFFPWAMEDSSEILTFSWDDVKYSIVSANNIDSMKKHLELLHSKWIKTLFDPWQQITQMTKSDLEYCFSYSNYIILNEYEYEVIKKISQKTDWDMIASFDFMILTYWLRWSKIFDKNYNIIEVHWIENPNFVDPTWAWDAYRAWLLKGLNDWYSLENSAKMWALLSSLSTEKFWSQNHSINWQDFLILYKETFWENLDKNI